MKFIHLVVCVFLGTFIHAQDINQFDTNGKRHGIWKKNFEGTNLPRYDGEFDHGKEIGLFKFYKIEGSKSVLAATKQFNNNNSVTVKFFDSDGRLISEGSMRGKLYLGTWNYYQGKDKKLLIQEHYDDNGNLHGERLVYYKSGKIAEKQNYSHGKLDGLSIWYTENESILKEFNYSNDELHGISKYYNPKGELITEGNYKNGKKDGVWKFYENGKLADKKDFTYVPKYIKKEDKYIKNPQKKPLN